MAISLFNILRLPLALLPRVVVNFIQVSPVFIITMISSLRGLSLLGQTLKWCSLSVCPRCVFVADESQVMIVPAFLMARNFIRGMS